MTAKLIVAAIAVVLCAGGGAAQADEWSQSLLDGHNAKRDLHCVPALSWSADLAAGAQEWANGCSMSHSDTDSGENLAWGGGLTAQMSVDMWYNEVSSYDYNAPGFGMSTGHFTQVVWRNSTELGCGQAECNGQTFMVCRYSPAGNYQGQFPDNVPQVCK